VDDAQLRHLVELPVVSSSVRSAADRLRARFNLRVQRVAVAIASA
jgi:hypothetical protein